MWVIWISLGLAGVVLMAAASRVALREATALGERLGVPKLVIGFTIVAFGTDLPEMVNSIASSAMGHGDVNLGDSIGSVLTQGTLVLGLLPFVSRRRAPPRRGEVVWLGSFTIALLALGAVLVRDGFVSRADGAVLVLAGAAALAASVRRFGMSSEDAVARRPASHALRHALIGGAALAGVGAGAGALVTAIVELALALGAPEYALSFFAASLGTSLPELVVNLSAMRRGQREIALGGVLGACLLDASVSVGVGPLLFPTAVTGDAALRGAAVAAAGLALAAVAIALRGRHDRATGAALLAAYALAYGLVAA